MRALYSFRRSQVSSGRVLRAFRRGFGFTLKDVSRLTGICELTLSAMEDDRRSLGQDHAKRLGAIYGLSPEHLLYPSRSLELGMSRILKIRQAALKGNGDGL